jgi:hypothetical protein
VHAFRMHFTPRAARPPPCTNLTPTARISATRVKRLCNPRLWCALPLLRAQKENRQLHQQLLLMRKALRTCKGGHRNSTATPTAGPGGAQAPGNGTALSGSALKPLSEDEGPSALAAG